jgi:hypothetical protein
MILTAGMEAADGKSYCGDTGCSGGSDGAAASAVGATAPGRGVFQAEVNVATRPSKV